MGMYTSLQAIEFAKNGRLEEWVHLFLNDEGDNIPFSQGLRLEPRYYLGPYLMPLPLFTRCCGPEPGIEYPIDEQGFFDRVRKIRDRFNSGWDMPPLIINYEDGLFHLTDGNHRYQALIDEKISEYYVIIWITKKTSYDDFIQKYLKSVKKP